VKEQFLRNPNLPESMVSLLMLSDMEPTVLNELNHLHIRCIISEPLPSISGSESVHADMSVCHVGNNSILMTPNISRLVKTKLLQEGFRCTYIAKEVTAEDPYLNACIIGDKAICHNRHTSPELIKELQQIGLNVLHTKQRYARCSTAILNENAVITADEGIASLCRSHQIDVLKITPGGIDLTGYPYGFIGGCCGLLSPSVLAFSGNIQQHRNYEDIQAFAKNHHISLLSLSNKPLTDIGGLLPLKEMVE